MDVILVRFELVFLFTGVFIYWCFLFTAPCATTSLSTLVNPHLLLFSPELCRFDFGKCTHPGCAILTCLFELVLDDHCFGGHSWGSEGLPFHHGRGCRGDGMRWIWRLPPTTPPFAVYGVVPKPLSVSCVVVQSSWHRAVRCLWTGRLIKSVVSQCLLPS